VTGGLFAVLALLAAINAIRGWYPAYLYTDNGILLVILHTMCGW